MAYCTKDDINALFGDISDDISDNMFTTVIDNCTAWIEANLKRHYGHKTCLMLILRKH